MNLFLALLRYKHLSLSVLWLWPLALLADNGGEGVMFAEGKTFNDILTTAKSEGKAVMIDCYTSWCVPCRKMAAEVFTQKEIGEYINTRFVAAKFDMEKGEGIELRNRFDVNAYPTFLFLDAEGNELCRILGYKTADAFRGEVERGLEGDVTASLRNKYLDGERSHDFMLSFVKALEDKRMMSERQRVMEDYVGTDVGKLLTDTLAFRFFCEMPHTPNDSLFISVYDRKEEFADVYGSWVIDKWWRVWYDYPERLRLTEGDDILYNDSLQNEYADIMNKHRVDGSSSIILYYKLFGANLKTDWPLTLSLAKEYAASEKIWDLNFVHICDRLLQYLQDKSQREQVLQIIEQRLKCLESVEDLPSEATLYSVGGNLVGPIGRSKIYYKSILDVNRR